MEFVLNTPLILTLPSCLTSSQIDYLIWDFLDDMIDAQRNWNKAKGGERQMGKTVTRMLRMEGIEDVIEPKLQNDQNGNYGRWIVDRSIKYNNLQGMNIQKR
ncbi:hypothetical protein BLNAU_4775 [Blattamonas nauphoetae]|uniref:Uncharacterized protein n=1 Tax=Blattamonas nauphoetae TaxID=2049346 RepID=A0ABQ9Y8Y5_9EUKA|nr:hypothetical protein BLNAU_4775 [Blattamonas nauphoetae]